MKPNAVFLLALAICVPVGLWGVLAPEAMAGAVLGFTTWFMVGASWWWLTLCSAFVIFAAVLALGPWGKIRLGADDDRPDFSTTSWIAMLFAGGMGAGLLFWGVAEQSSHFESPPGMIGGGGAADHAGRRAHGTVRRLVPHLLDLVARLGGGSSASTSPGSPPGARSGNSAAA